MRPATLYRNYFVNGKDSEQRDRTYSYDAKAMENEVNTLDDPHIADLLPVVKGFVTFTKAPTAEDVLRLKSDAYKHVKIVRHDFTQVSYGLRQDPVMNVCGDHKQIVNQIFNAGIDWTDMSDYVRDEETQKEFAMFLSKASMISSLLAAQENRDALANVPYCHGRNRFFPTLVGCGVFRNKREWLMEAWSSPEVWPYILNSGLEIVVCLYAGTFTNQHTQECTGVQNKEALDFALAAQAGSIRGFEGQKLDVEIIDGNDYLDMKRVFGLPEYESPRRWIPKERQIAQSVPHADSETATTAIAATTATAASTASTASTTSTSPNERVGDRPRLKLPSTFNLCCM